jgi:hypothetical protein
VLAEDSCSDVQHAELFDLVCSSCCRDRSSLMCISIGYTAMQI